MFRMLVVGQEDQKLASPFTCTRLRAGRMACMQGCTIEPIRMPFAVRFRLRISQDTCRGLVLNINRYNMASEHRAHNRLLICVLTAYALSVLLLVATSARLWWQSPIELIAHEFDYFLGLFTSLDKDQARLWLARGHLVHLLGFLVVGLLYLALVRLLLRNPQALAKRGTVCYAALVSIIFALGMPWVSPDVFFYIGKGWAESHYGVSPYLVPIDHLPGYRSDQMFANIFPGFLTTATGYGPLFQKIAEMLAALSGGNEKLAIALHKFVNLVLHGACSFLVYRLAPSPFARVMGLAYAVNPLICFSILTCVHNDHWMNVFMLLTLLAMSRRHWAWAGVALGASFGIKYFPLLYAPIIGLAALLQGGSGRGVLEGLADAFRFTFGFIAMIAASFIIFYPEALPHFVGTLGSGGAPVYRNSIYHLADSMSLLVFPALFGTKAVSLSYQTIQDMGASLRAIYVVVYAFSLLLFLKRLRKDPLLGSVEACLAVTILYFITANTSNQEWYLTWLIGFALVLPYVHARSFALHLSALFLPLVIFTVKGTSIFVHLSSNAMLYVLVVVLGCSYLWRSSRATDILPRKNE